MRSALDDPGGFWSQLIGWYLTQSPPSAPLRTSSVFHAVVAELPTNRTTNCEAFGTVVTSATNCEAIGAVVAADRNREQQQLTSSRSFLSLPRCLTRRAQVQRPVSNSMSCSTRKMTVNNSDRTVQSQAAPCNKPFRSRRKMK